MMEYTCVASCYDTIVTEPCYGFANIFNVFACASYN